MTDISRVLLVLLLIWGCAEFPDSSRFTIRPSDMDRNEFLALADAQVREHFPEWYVEGIRQEIELDNPKDEFAAVTRQADGTFLMSIYKPAWNLYVVEDLVTVLLHEYVHVKLWDWLAEKIPYEACNHAIHELTAYGVELTQSRIRITEPMLWSARSGFNSFYLQGKLHCSEEIIQEFTRPGVSLSD